MTEETNRLGLTADLIEDDQDVEMLRQIRNACKDGFAHDNTEITPQAQAAWWIVSCGAVRAWLYWTVEAGVVGYGLLRKTDDGRWWSSVAVLPSHAGHGYGGAITADLVRHSDQPTWGTARLDNPAAMRLHRAVDWEEVERDDRLVTYRTRPHVYMAQTLEEWTREGWVTA